MVRPTGRSERGLPVPRAPEVEKESGHVGPGNGDPLHVHHHIPEARLDHRVTDIVHIYEINDMRPIIHRRPTFSKLLQGPGTEGRESDEPTRAKHAPRLAEDGPRDP